MNSASSEFFSIKKNGKIYKYGGGGTDEWDLKCSGFVFLTEDDLTPNSSQSGEFFYKFLDDNNIALVSKV